MTTEKEIWRPYPGDERKEVSTHGRFRSVDGHYYRGWLDMQGYVEVTFRINGKCVHKRVHRIVAETFLPNLNNYSEVNHKDCDRTNNNVNNLEWCTRTYNQEYKEKFGKSQNCPVFAVNLSTSKVFWFQSRGEAGRKLNINVGSVSAVAVGKTKMSKEYWFTNADLNAVDDAHNRLCVLIGDKIKDLIAGDSSKEAEDFIAGLKD